MTKWIQFTSITLIFIASTVMAAEHKELRVGGLSDEKPADDSVKSLVDTLKPQLTSKIQSKICSGKDTNVCQAPTTFEVVSYKEQVVSGMNYFVKLVSRENDKTTYWHARIYHQPWTKTLELSDIEGPHEERSPIIYF